MRGFFVYVTTASDAEAREVAKAALESRLAACANILSGMRAIYWWDGALQEDTETVLVLKTTEEKLEALVQKVKAHHSYRVLCVVALPIAGGNPDYLEWIAHECRGNSLA